VSEHENGEQQPDCRDDHEQTARSRAQAELSGIAARQARAAISSMIAGVDPASPHDDLAALLVAVAFFGEQYREVKSEADAAALRWLLTNDHREVQIRAGDVAWWGEREKSTKCGDVGDAGAAAARRLHGEQILEVVFGDEQAAARILELVRDLFREVVSAGGLKEGATRAALGEEFAKYYTTTWPDRLESGAPKMKLGVGNLRFQKRVTRDATKKELEAADAREAGAQTDEEVPDAGNG
jgi:hypothetical protein